MLGLHACLLGVRSLPAIRRLNGLWPDGSWDWEWGFRKSCWGPQPRPAKTEQKSASSHSEWASDGWQPPWRRAKQTFRDVISLPPPPSPLKASPNTRIFKEPGQPKVGHAVKPKGKLSRLQLPCSHRDNADSPRGQVALETCPRYLESQLPWAICFQWGLKEAVKAKLRGALLCLPQLCVSVLELTDNPVGWRKEAEQFIVLRVSVKAMPLFTLQWPTVRDTFYIITQHTLIHV